MSRLRLIVFARYPAPGAAKTRLRTVLGTHGAPLLQHRMTLHTLQTAGSFAAASGAALELRAGGEPARMRELYPGPWQVRAQCEGSLGERLSNAVGDAFAEGAGRVVAIGSDCPPLTAAHLSEAFAALSDHDVVLGPATDGGYYLIGLRRPIPDLFQDIAWSSDRVLDQTLAAAGRLGLSLHRLPVLADVDRPEDLACVPPVFRPRRIAVTGATGALGTRFLQRMLRDVPELEATALVRRDSRSLQRPEFQRLVADYGPRLRLVEGDLRWLNLPPAERRAMTETDGGLWHFAADTRLASPDGPSATTAWQTNDGGAATLLDALESSDRPGPFFHVSTAYVCGAEVGVAREVGGAPPGRLRNGYEASKLAAEGRVRKALDAGLPGCIYRPSVIVGDDSGGGAGAAVDRLADALVQTLRRGGPPLVLRVPADAQINVVHADWVIEAMLTLAAGGASGRTYHLTARRPLELTDLASAAAGRREEPLFVMHPTADVRALSPLSRAVDRALAPLWPYLAGKVRFDRSNFDRDASGLRALPEFDASAVLDHRMLCLARAAVT